MELRLRQFLRGKEPLEPSLGLTLVKVDAFASSILAEGIEATLNRMLGRKSAKLGMDLIEQIAEKLTGHAQGIERDLLSKSVQETLFHCVGTDPDLSDSQVRSRLKRHLDDHGATDVSHRFVSLCFFNIVWFQTGESFRSAASTRDSFEKDLEDVEQTCRKIVESAWTSLNLTERPLDPSKAEELVSAIEQRLRGELR